MRLDVRLGCHSLESPFLPVTFAVVKDLTEDVILPEATVRELSEYGKMRDWIGLCSVLRPLQHSIGYMGDGFYRSKDPTNSIKLLKENLQNTNQTTETTQNTDIDIQ